MLKCYFILIFVNIITQLRLHYLRAKSLFILQKLISVSPNLPKLIGSMNVQPPKENEIVLLSGLTSGNLQADYEVPQVGIKLCLRSISQLWRKEFLNWKKKGSPFSMDWIHVEKLSGSWQTKNKSDYKKLSIWRERTKIKEIPLDPVDVWVAADNAARH